MFPLVWGEVCFVSSPHGHQEVVPVRGGGLSLRCKQGVRMLRVDWGIGWVGVVGGAFYCCLWVTLVSYDRASFWGIGGLFSAWSWEGGGVLGHVVCFPCCFMQAVRQFRA